MKTLYEVTNNILDLNTILVNRNEYNELLADKKRLDWAMPILTGEKGGVEVESLCSQFLEGKTGREAIDGAMAS